MYKRIRDLREDRDKNQTEIAKMLGCLKRAILNTKPEKTIFPPKY